MLAIGIGVGVAIGGLVIWLLSGVIWHTYHGELPEVIAKIFISLLVIGLGIAAIIAVLGFLPGVG